MKRLLKLTATLMLTATLLVSCSTAMLNKSEEAVKVGYYLDFKSDSELEYKFSQRGSYKVKSVSYESGNKDIGAISIWYPETNDNQKLPVILVVNGSNTPAAVYVPFFERLASWGFAVVGNEDPQTGTGKTASITLDFILDKANENSLPVAIDVDEIGIIGYSQGGAGAINAVTRYENGNVYKALFTGSAAYQLLSKNSGWEYDITKIDIPYFMSAGTGWSDDTGWDMNNAFGGVAPLASLIQNYNAISSDVSKVRARITGAEHTDMLTLSDPYMTAWMLYQLKDDQEAAKVFIGDDAELMTNTHWQDVEKNF